MIEDLVYLFAVNIFISLATFGGGAQALFYQYAIADKQWISSTDLSAVLAFGYATPGPAVFGTATFIGYRVAGLPGAVISTLGIYLMPFVLALLATRYLNSFMNRPAVKAAITGLGLGAAGLVGATALGMANITLADIGANFWQVAVFVAAAVGSLYWKLNPLYVLVAGGLAGLVL